MVGIALSNDGTEVSIVGRGITVKHDFELQPGIFVSPNVPQLQIEATSTGCKSFFDYAAVINGHPNSSFAIRVEHQEGGRPLAVKAWNALWNFNLLSIACQVPCASLYSVCNGVSPTFAATTPAPLFAPKNTPSAATAAQLEWAKTHFDSFDALINDASFSAAMRAYSGANTLPEHDVRIMLLWAGIEGLLSVDAELNRRLALYAALMFVGTDDEKAEHYDFVKKAYGLRSRAVHGNGLGREKLREGCDAANGILIRLLSRCVEIGRVPTSAELDRLAVSATIK